MRFAFLADHMPLAPVLARLHYAEWGALLPDWSEPAACAELQTHVHRAAIPTTMLGLDPADGAVIGSVSLLQNDDERIRDYSPWLASLLVLPAYRGQGHGIALVRHCVQIAAELNVVRLHLYTEGQRAFYEKLGWASIDRMPLGNAQVDVMAIAPGSAAA
jgi:GNAT superfamily N-acetyltransferase